MNTATRSRSKTFRQQGSVSYPEPSCTGALTPPPKLKTIIYPDNTKEHFTYTKSGQIETHTSREGIVQRIDSRNYSHEGVSLFPGMSSLLSVALNGQLKGLLKVSQFFVRPC